MKRNYTMYHCHSDISNLASGTGADSVTKYEHYIELAKEYGMEALGISEHGAIINWIEKKKKIEQAGMKYIHASEVYLTKNTYDKLERDNYHLIMIARNYEGVKEMNKLLSIANERETGQFYYNPRITFGQLKDTSDNIIITTACLGSPIWQLYKDTQIVINTEEDQRLVEDSESELLDLLEWMSKNKHRTFLEIQYHNHHEQIEYNRLLLRLSNEYDIPLIVGTDTHSKDNSHAKAREVLLKSKGASYGDEDTFDLTFKSYDELVKMFEKQNALLSRTYLEAIENTNKLADMIEEFELDKTPKYPKMYDNPIETFKEKINEGVIKRGIDKFKNKADYYSRIREEFDIYVKLDTVDYMLLMKNIIDWSTSQGIMHGYGRGSVTGSLIAYVLGITEMDSIKHNLKFSRFLNADRVSLPDIDTDYPSSRRQEVIDYVASLKGVHFAEIITLNTMALRGAIDEAGRGLGMSNSEVNSIKNSIVEYGGKSSVSSSVRKKYSELFEYVDILNGVIISMGSHPSGFIVSPIDLDTSISTLYTKESKYRVTAVNMNELDGENFVKLDLLGLDNIELMNDICKLAGIERLTPDNIDVDDMKVWETLRESTLGIFQMESQTAFNYIKKLFSKETLDNIKNNVGDIDYIDLLSIANGAIRPSGSSYRDQIANGEMHDNGHEVLNNFLSPTLGQVVFQEQLMQFLTDFCGFTGSESDTVRRGFAKKTGTEQFIPKIREGFIKHMTTKYGESVERAEELIKYFIKVIEDSSDYAFSVNHAQPYSYLGYAITWLRYYYPLEFLTVALNIWDDNEDKTGRIINYAKSKNIEIKPISFGNSRASYTLNRDENNIYKGIASIKFLNKQVAEELYDLSLRKDYDKNNWVDFLVDVLNETSTNAGQMEILIRLDFFKEFGKKEVLLEIYLTMIERKRGNEKPKKANTILYPEFADRVETVIKRRRNKITKKMEDVEEEKIIKIPLKYDITHKEPTKKKRLENLYAYEKAVRANPPRKIELYEQIAFEKENLGYAVSTYPSVKDSYALVIDVNKRFTPWVTLYKIKTGEEISVKISKKKFWVNDEDLLVVGDIIKVLEVHQEYGWKHLGNNKFDRDKTKIELHLDRCRIVKPSVRR